MMPFYALAHFAQQDEGLRFRCAYFIVPGAGSFWKEHNVQFSATILDQYVAPKLSELSKCGAPPLVRNQNYFASFLSLSVFRTKYKQPLHALLVVYFRRVDFACVEYRNGRKQLRTYVDKLPYDNSKTRFYRLALCHFESCAINIAAALKCGQAISKITQDTVPFTESQRRLLSICNRIRHFDEDVFDQGKVQPNFGIGPTWITDAGIESSKASLSFQELHSILRDSLLECAGFVQTLADGVTIETTAKQ